MSPGYRRQCRRYRRAEFRCLHRAEARFHPAGCRRLRQPAVPARSQPRRLSRIPMRHRPRSFRRLQRMGSPAQPTALPSRRGPSPRAREASASRESRRQGRVLAPHHSRRRSRPWCVRGPTRRRSRRQGIESRTWCRISRLAWQAYRNWDSAPSYPSVIPVMRLRPLEAARLRRMVHRGLPSAIVLMPGLDWPSRRRAATIPV